MSRRSTAVVLVAGLVAAAAGVIAAGRAARPPPRLVVAAVRQPATSLLFVALAAGCMREQRVEIVERDFELGRDALADLLDGAADVAIAYETPTLKSYARDGRLRVLTYLHSSTRNTRVVARRDRGITSIADLRGKRVSAASGTNADFFVEHLTTSAGIPRSELAVVHLEPQAAPAALAAGEIDAAVLSDPYAEQAQRALGAGAVELVSDLYAEFSLVLTRADVAAARREALLALLRGLSCGERVLRDRPEEAFAAVRERFPEQGDAELRAALDRVERGIGLDEVLWWVLERESRWLHSSGGGASPMPDIRDLVDERLLEEVEPTTVNLLVRP